MVTIDLDNYDMETEIKITAAKSRLSVLDAERVVKIVRALREKSASGYLPTIRGSIMVGKSVKKYKGAEVSESSDKFRKICHDVLIPEMSRKTDRYEKESLRGFLDELIKEHCSGSYKHKLHQEVHISVPKEAHPIPVYSPVNIKDKKPKKEKVKVKSEDTEPKKKHESFFSGIFYDS